jgi:hypothetical protein
MPPEAVLAVRPEPAWPAEYGARLLAHLLDRVRLLLGQPAGLDVGVQLGVDGVRQRVAQLGWLDVEPLGGVGEHGLLALLGVVGPGGGHRHARSGGDERAGRGDGGNACASHGGTPSASRVRATLPHRKNR